MDVSINPADVVAIASLIRVQRQAALGTLCNGAPFVSMVAYAAERDFGGFVLHLSRLAPHTQNLLANPRASLMICQPDPLHGDVQTLRRLTLVGVVKSIASGSHEYKAARALYLERLPTSAPLFGFPDFALYRFVPSEVRYVGGFARAFTLSAEGLRATADVVEGDEQPVAGR